MLLPDDAKTLPEPMLTNCQNQVPWDSFAANFTEMLKISIIDMSLNTTNLRVHPHHPGANKLIWVNKTHLDMGHP